MSATHDGTSPDAHQPTWADRAWGEVAEGLGLSYDYEPVSGHDHPRDAVIAHARALRPDNAVWSEVAVLGNMLRLLVDEGADYVERWPDETVAEAVRRGWVEVEEGGVYLRPTPKLISEATSDTSPDPQTAADVLWANATVQERAELGLAGERDPATGNGRLSGAEIVALAQVLDRLPDELPTWLQSAVDLLRPLTAINHDAPEPAGPLDGIDNPTARAVLALAGLRGEMRRGSRRRRARKMAHWCNEADGALRELGLDNLDPDSRTEAP